MNSNTVLGKIMALLSLDSKEGEEKLNEVVNLMKNAVELNVPLEVDVERGASWGEIK